MCGSVLGAGIGAGRLRKKAAPTPTPSATPAATQSVKPTTHPDLWSETKVFGLVMDMTDTTVSAMVAEEIRVFQLTDFAKKCIKDLGIQVGNEAAFEFETTSEGKYIAKSIEKVNK